MKFITLTVLAASMLAGCAPSPPPPPLVDLATLENCAMRDLGVYWGSNYQFHRDGCLAKVTFDESGKVLAFEPEDAKMCEQVLAKCR